MTCKKALLSSAIAAVIGVAAAGTASAATVTNMTVQEIGASGVGTSGAGTGGGIFYFSTAAQIPDGSTNGSTVSFSGAPDIVNGTVQNTITSGFLFGGTTPVFQFQPNSCGGNPPAACVAGATTGLAATHTGSTLNIDLSGWGGFYTAFGAQFPLFPDGIQQAPIVTASALGAGGLNPDQFYYTADWTHTITAAENFAFAGQVADWHIEGIGTVAAVPIPAAVWLFGSGLVGLAGVARRKKS